MVLQDEQTGFWCHTLLKDIPEKILFGLKGKQLVEAYGFYVYFSGLKRTNIYLSILCYSLCPKKIRDILKRGWN